MGTVTSPMARLASRLSLQASTKAATRRWVADKHSTTSCGSPPTSEMAERSPTKLTAFRCSSCVKSRLTPRSRSRITATTPSLFKIIVDLATKLSCFWVITTRRSPLTASTARDTPSTTTTAGTNLARRAGPKRGSPCQQTKWSSSQSQTWLHTKPKTRNSAFTSDAFASVNLQPPNTQNNNNNNPHFQLSPPSSLPPSHI